MTKKYAILAGPLLVALFGVAFCVWTALGNDVNICVTTGCNLYQDFTIGKISLWWFGTGAFVLLAALSLLGQATIGRYFAGLFLLADACLLLLMAVTAPCISCLVVALLFAISYILFRRAVILRQQRPNSAIRPGFSLLFIVWLILFVVDVGQVGKSQFDVWPILDESGEPVVRMFFSPTCRYCIEGVNALSGNINVAFYPVADNDGDVARIERMQFLLAEGQNLAEAVNMVEEVEFTGFWQQIKPATLLLRFRLLCNKAHLFAQGSQGVPFFEYKGLPPGLGSQPKVHRSLPKASTGNADLPGELLESTQCGGQVPCPPAEQNMSTPLPR